MLASGRARLALAFAALATVVVGAAACGTTTLPSPTRTTAAPTPADSPTPTPTPTVDPTDAAILNAYDQAMVAWDTAAADPNTQAEYPGIFQWYTGNALSLAVGRLDILGQLGQVEVGTYTPHPIVTSVDASTATVNDCGWDTRYIVSKGTNTPVSPQPWGGTTTAGWDNSSATMVLQSRTWLLTQLTVETTPCIPASPSP
jgi:hypothetical protein